MSVDLSKDEKERLLDAKIAAMRAKNAQRAQRHTEVEQDKKQAEKFNMSVTIVPKGNPIEQDENFESPFQLDKSKLRNRKNRVDATIENAGKGSKKPMPGSGRLGDKDAPPPDPGYRFLADRMRDGSDEDDNEGEKRREGRRKEDSWSRGGRGRAGRGRGMERDNRGERRGSSRNHPEGRWDTDSRNQPDGRWNAEPRNHLDGRREADLKRNDSRIESTESWDSPDEHEHGNGFGGWGRVGGDDYSGRSRGGGDGYGGRGRGGGGGDDFGGRGRGGGRDDYGMRGRGGEDFGGRGRIAQISPNSRRREDHNRPIRRNTEDDWDNNWNSNNSRPEQNNSNKWNGKPDPGSPRHNQASGRSNHIGSNETSNWKDIPNTEECWDDPEDDHERKVTISRGPHGSNPRMVHDNNGKITVTAKDPDFSHGHNKPLIKPLLKNSSSSTQLSPSAPKFTSSVADKFPPPMETMQKHPAPFPNNTTTFPPPSSRNKSDLRQDLPTATWQCPDPGCKMLNPASSHNCPKCGLPYSAANDYLNNRACDRVKQEFTTRKSSFSERDETINQPPIPQPMLPAQAQGIKDWGESGQPVIPDSWGVGALGNQTDWGAMQQMLDPSIQYNMMLSDQMQLPNQLHTIPPPFYNNVNSVRLPNPIPPFQFQPAAAAQVPEFYTPIPQPLPDYSIYPPVTTMPVFNPSQTPVFIPPASQLQANIYQAPPPTPSQPYQPQSSSSLIASSRQNYHPANKPIATKSTTDSNLMISLNKPPTPLTLRRPPDSYNSGNRQSPDKTSYNRPFEQRSDRPSFNRQSSTETSNSQPSSKLPPRFQRQRESSAQNQPKPPSLLEMQSGSLKKGTFPPPPPSSKGKGLIVFGTSNVINNLEDNEFSQTLGIPVRSVAAMKLEAFHEKVNLLNPSCDWLVLIHGLGNDARSIALKHKSDQDKAQEADNTANEFCDVVEKRVLGAAPHICVLISMLLPRSDFSERPGMGNPNNVRKVMNVQITSRLYDNPRVTLISTDSVLDGGEKEELIQGDGYHLTQTGFKALLDSWVVHIIKRIHESGVETASSTPSSSNTATREHSGEKREEEAVGDIEGEDETVPDPFGEYEPPGDVMSPKSRTVSTSGKNPDDVDKEMGRESVDLDDDSIPSLETVSAITSANNSGGNIPAQLAATSEDYTDKSELTKHMSNIRIEKIDSIEACLIKAEALKAALPLDESVEDEEEFHDVDDGGFIEDNYCGTDVNVTKLPSLGSDCQEPTSDIGLVSGHFMEDSYFPNTAEQSQINRATVEFVYKEKVAKKVRLGGDFNSWKPADMECFGDSDWRLLIDLPEGVYEYKYLVDGDWCLDSTTETVDTDGNLNHIIRVGK